MLDGTFGSAQFQVGANVGETIGVNLTTGMRTNQIGQIASATGTAVTGNALTDGGLTIAVGTGAAVSVGASVAGTATGQEADSAYAKAQAINNAGVAGLTTTAANSHSGAFVTVGGAGGTTASTYNLTINDVAIYSGTGNIAIGASLTAADVVAQVNLYSSQTGVSASVSGTTLELHDDRWPQHGRSSRRSRCGTGAARHRYRGRLRTASCAARSRCPPRTTSLMTGQFADVGHGRHDREGHGHALERERV